MRRMIAVTVAVSALLTAAACGSEATPGGGGATTAAAPTAAATSLAGAAAVTPDQVCALVSVADMSRISGFAISRTKTETSGDVAVCHYIGTVDGFESSKVITEYQPTGKAAMEYTKSKGEAVAGLGEAAVWFSTGAQLLVEVGGDAVFGVYVEDVRLHNGDPKTGARQVAEIAVAQLARS